MREAREEMLQSIHEANVIDKVKDIVKRKSAAKIDGVLVDLFTASAISQIYDKVNPMNKKKMERLPIKKLASAAMRVMDKNEYVPEEVELDEAKYDLYHKDFSSAMQHAYKMAKKLHGITVDPKEIDDKVATGPAKPKEGKTNSYRLKGDKGSIQVQVYNKGGSKPFELNMYKEEVELDEEFKKGDKVTVKVAKSSDREIQQLSKKFGDTVSGVVMGQSGKILMVKTDKGQINPPVKDVMKEEVELDESVIDKVKEIASKKSAAKIDGVMVDSFSASAISQIYDKVNDANKKKMEKLPITKLANLAFKMMQKNDYVPEETDLDEAKQKPYVSSDRDGFHVMNGSGKIAKSFKDEKLAQAYFKKNYDKLMKEKLDKEDEPKVKEIIKKLKGASQAHAGQAKDLQKAVTEKDELDEAEAYSPKQIKMAIGIASDPRYKGGNYSGAVKAIEKIKGGLSQDKQVAAVLKRQNEALGENLDGRTREYRQHRERLESLRSKRLEARHTDPADIDTSATDDDIKSADKNIMMQLRKSVSLRGQYSVEFLDKKKVKVPQKIALAVIAKYNSLKKPMDKEKFQAKIAKSHKDLLMGLKESLDEKKKKDKIKIGEESTLDRMNKKLQEKKNG